MAVISVPRELREKLGDPATDSLVDLLHQFGDEQRQDLIAVVEEGSLAQAAGRLGLTQPAVTRRRTRRRSQPSLRSERIPKVERLENCSWTLPNRTWIFSPKIFVASATNGISWLISSS